MVVGPFVVAASLPLVPVVCAVSGATGTLVGVGVALVHGAGACIRYFSITA